MHYIARERERERHAESQKEREVFFTSVYEPYVCNVHYNTLYVWMLIATAPAEWQQTPNEKKKQNKT